MEELQVIAQMYLSYMLQPRPNFTDSLYCHMLDSFWQDTVSHAVYKYLSAIW